MGSFFLLAGIRKRISEFKFLRYFFEFPYKEFIQRCVNLLTYSDSAGTKLLDQKLGENNCDSFFAK